MYYTIFRRSRNEDRPEDGTEASDTSRLAPLNPAHLTHEPVRRRWSWIRFAAGAAVGALVFEAFRLGLLQFP
ncbi:hypothetical protein WDL1CHR_02153 [Variovorax sp. WDL1]|uniref:hypothetical protein n=1 Tax=unclassified Variovorax TaxID=663243 RepID=UPI00076CC0A1|nr:MULTISPECIES: hypothetical protein [unclassified Variovorax]KWT72298.1 hypothetical protein APY03_6323 [Variovorax sp. WDL1]PNG53245.1 hypothetical protein CHC06_04592 [Variovorax sp. B2]PNG53817.1 hypothetical protein CHC07_03639 [Variovorax sp. B4]VTV11275.1 hypothetical protein WDL1CHR_02153 [Variovorax sp. WDL1]